MHYSVNFARAGQLATILLMLASPASADATNAWGTSGSRGGASSSGTASAILNKSQGEIAQIATIGRNIKTMYRSNTSCGSCVYYQIEGDDNTISENAAESSNTGSITSEAVFK